MNLRTTNDVLSYLIQEISVKRSERISFSFFSHILNTSEIYKQLIAKDPRLFLCVNSLSLSVTHLGMLNRYTIDVSYSDVYPTFVRLADSTYQVNDSLLSSAQTHRKNDYIVCKVSDLEMVLNTVKNIVSKPEYLNCYISGVQHSVLRREETDYVGIVVRLLYSCDYKTAKVRARLLNDKIEYVANIARSAGNEDWCKAYAAIKYCVENWRYCLTSDNGLEFTAYGALIQNQAVCMGFSLAVCAVFKELGIPCQYICGKKNGEGHAWNMVYINGGWFYIDVTDAIKKQDPLFHWGITEFDDGRTISTNHGQNLECHCDRKFIIRKLCLRRR